jgi:hypothetical protein
MCTVQVCEVMNAAKKTGERSEKDKQKKCARHRNRCLERTRVRSKSTWVRAHTYPNAEARGQIGADRGVNLGNVHFALCLGKKRSMRE